MAIAAAQITMSLLLIIGGSFLTVGWQRVVFNMLSGFLLISGILGMFG